MDVYDTNVWIFGLSDQDSRAGQLVQQAIHGDRHVAVDAYIYQEVLQNIGDGVSNNEREDIKNAFATFVHKSDTIYGPTHEQVDEVDIYDERGKYETLLIADAVWCQPKDAPIVTLAYRTALSNEGESTIFSNDGRGSSERGLVDIDFSEFREPAQKSGRLYQTVNGLREITTEYVPEPPSVS